MCSPSNSTRITPPRSHERVEQPPVGPGLERAGHEKATGPQRVLGGVGCPPGPFPPGGDAVFEDRRRLTSEFRRSLDVPSGATTPNAASQAAFPWARAPYMAKPPTCGP